MTHTILISKNKYYRSITEQKKTTNQKKNLNNPQPKNIQSETPGERANSQTPNRTSKANPRLPWCTHFGEKQYRYACLHSSAIRGDVYHERKRKA